MNDLNEKELEPVSGGGKSLHFKGPMEMKDIEDKLTQKFSSTFHRRHLEKQFELILNDLQNPVNPFDTAIRHCQEFSLADTRNDKLYFRLWDDLIMYRAAFQEG